MYRIGKVVAELVDDLADFFPFIGSYCFTYSSLKSASSVSLAEDTYK